MTTSAASPENDPLSFAASFRELANSVRSLVADEVDLVGAEVHVAMRTMVACLIAAVAAALFAVLAVGAVFVLLAFELVAIGMSWPAALGAIAAACAIVCGGLALSVKGLVHRKFFAATRRQLRGRS